MTDRLFNLDIKNTSNEVIYKSVPGLIGPENVVIEQTGNRTIIDTYSSCIRNANMQPEMLAYGYDCRCSSAVPQIQTHSLCIPGGVSFTFSTEVHNDPLYSSQPVTHRKVSRKSHCHSTPICMHQQNENNYSLQDLIACRQIETDRSKYSFLNEHTRPVTYNVDFHYNKKTSTTDLLQRPPQTPESRGLPDFNNLCTVIEDLNTNRCFKHCCSCLNSTASYSISKKLFLRNTPDLQPIGGDEMYNLGKEDLNNETVQSNLQENCQTGSIVLIIMVDRSGKHLT